MESETTHGSPAFTVEPGEEHRWLRKLVGDWVYETPAPAEPGKPAGTLTGTERVRFLGDIWFVAEGEGEMPDGATGRTLMTLGYDPAKQRFVGTWLGTMMHHLWVYEGELDDSGKVLTLESVGPDFEAPGRTRQYRDAIEVEDDDHRLLIGRILGGDGEWQEIMRARYRRVSTGP
jgi:hypothetical protein